MEARYITFKLCRGFFNLLFSLNLLNIFSISIIASSTTSPKAIAKPPITIMFRLVPVVNVRIAAKISDIGIAKAEIRAAFKFDIKTIKTNKTNIPPTAK